MKSFVQTLALILAIFTVQIGFAQSSDHNMMKKDKMTEKSVAMKDKAMKSAPQIIDLSQTPGQYETTELNLTEGTYIFRVTNKNVDKGLGFYLTPTSDAKAQVPNSGLAALVNKGETSQTGIVELKAGEYQYSCPLNPTPHYFIKVSKGK